jgi:hypothetical protein
MNTPCMLLRSAQMFRQVGAHDVDDEGRRFAGRRTWAVGRARTWTAAPGGAGCPSASTRTGGSSVTMRAMRRRSSHVVTGPRSGKPPRARPRICNAVRVDVVQVPDQVGSRSWASRSADLVEAPLRGARGRQSIANAGLRGAPRTAGRQIWRPASCGRLDRLPGTDELMHNGRVGLRLQSLAQLALAEHLGDFSPENLQVTLASPPPAPAGTISRPTGCSSSGASNPIGLTHAAKRPPTAPSAP